MSDNYIIEIKPPAGGITLPAGIVVRDGRGFRFFAASRVFDALEGQHFNSAQKAQEAALRHIAGIAARRPATNHPSHGSTFAHASATEPTRWNGSVS